MLTHLLERPALAEKLLLDAWLSGAARSKLDRQ